MFLTVTFLVRCAHKKPLKGQKTLRGFSLTWEWVVLKCMLECNASCHYKTHKKCVHTSDNDVCFLVPQYHNQSVFCNESNSSQCHLGPKILGFGLVNYFVYCYCCQCTWSKTQGDPLDSWVHFSFLITSRYFQEVWVSEKYIPFHTVAITTLNQ